MLLSIAIASCGGGSANPSPASNGTVRLNNTSGVTIDEFYLSPASSSSWGADQLGASTLPTGFYYDVPNVPVGSYDARAIVLGAFSIYRSDLYGFSVTANATYTLVAAAGSFTGSLKVVNNTVGANIIALYVTPSTSSTWGSNQISSSIGPAGSMHLYYLYPENYDVQVVWDVGPDSIYVDQTVSSLSLLTLSVI